MERLIWVIVSAFLIIRLRCTKKLPLCNDVTLQFIYCFCSNVTAYTSVCVYVIFIFFLSKVQLVTEDVTLTMYERRLFALSIMPFCDGFAQDFFCLTAICDQQTQTISKASTSKGKKITHKFADAWCLMHSATSMKDPVCVIQRLWLVLL